MTGLMARLRRGNPTGQIVLKVCVIVKDLAGQLSNLPANHLNMVTKLNIFEAAYRLARPRTLCCPWRERGPGPAKKSREGSGSLHCWQGDDGGVPVGEAWLAEGKAYEKTVLSKRN